jgi:hypothetical protein
MATAPRTHLAPPRAIHATVPAPLRFETAATSASSHLDRRLWLVVFLAAAIVLPRSYLIARAHSESHDADYHLTRGLAFLTRSLAGCELDLNDPPLGEGLVALPLLVTNLVEGRAAADDRLYDAPGRAEKAAVRIAIWNSTLFLGFLGVVFAWCRRLYGWLPACLAVALFVVDPNVAAHVPLPTLDILGVEGIVIASWLAWRYFERPTTARLLAMGFAIACALLLKHTALVVPAIVVALTGLHGLVLPGHQTGLLARLFGRVRSILPLVLVVPAAMWTLTLFDCSPPMNQAAIARQEIGTRGGDVSRAKAFRVSLERGLRFDSPWPAGCYLHALRLGMGHAMSGHLSYLNGVWSDRGRAAYFPIVAAHKVPIGIGLVLLIGLASFVSGPPRWSEWGLALPLLACIALALTSKINIGFRHFLPAYAFMIMLASRALARPGRLCAGLAWLGVIAAALHSVSYHPDYLSYLNAPRHKAYLTISDSNVDWGQALKEVSEWLDTHANRPDKPALFYFGKDNGCVPYYLSDRVIQVDEHSPPLQSGLLLISPMCLVNDFDHGNPYAALRDEQPDHVIGHSILVFDLDRALRRKHKPAGS